MTLPRLLAIAALSFGTLALAATAAHAHDFKLGDLRIGHPYARATVPGQPTGAGYLKLENAGKNADKLLSASAEVSKTVELHSMTMEGDVMRMREVGAIDLPADRAVELKPGGLHLMFIGLKAPLKAGDTFPLKLRFQKAGETTVTVNVEAAPEAAPSQHQHKH